MNVWMILAIIVAAILFAGITVYALTGYATAGKSSGGCGNCDGKCNAEKNCGLQGCGAVAGGKCGCGK